MATVQLEVDPRLLARCDAARRAELIEVARELAASPPVLASRLAQRFDDAQLTVRLVLRSERAATLELLSPTTGLPVSQRQIHWRTLARVFREYREVIERIVATGHFDRDKFEALDWGKKVVHNEAAALLRQALDGFLELDDEAARQLFTLLFLIKTELPPHVVRYHRAHMP